MEKKRLSSQIEVETAPDRPQGGISLRQRWSRKRRSCGQDTAAETRGAAEPNKHGVVLLVEDDALLRRFIERVLRKKFESVISAASGDEALELFFAHRSRLTLVVSDVMMPGLSCAELLRIVKATHPEVPVLLISGCSEEVISAFGMEDYQSLLLRKPFTGPVLMDKISALLDGAAQSTNS